MTSRRRRTNRSIWTLSDHRRATRLERPWSGKLTVGNQVGPTLAFTAANGNPMFATNGVFDTTLDFGALAFNGVTTDQRFLEVSVSGSALAPRTPIQKEHFRRFLLARLHTYLAEDWHGMHDKTAHAREMPTEDLDTRYLRDDAHAGSPEQAFRRGFALEVLARSFERLHAEARQTGHADMYAALVPFLGCDPAPGQYVEVARQLHTRPLAIVVALKRLRQRLRELASEELADTVSSTDELVAEQQALFSVLQGAG
jgi:hypothetical protein